MTLVTHFFFCFVAFPEKVDYTEKIFAPTFENRNGDVVPLQHEKKRQKVLPARG